MSMCLADINLADIYLASICRRRREIMTSDRINKTLMIADGAKIVGDEISIGENRSVWFNTVIRCDEPETVTIGKETNIQDLSTVHTGPGHNVRVGNGVTVGHMCLIHGCTIGDNTLIGMGSIIMNDAVVGNNCIIGAGSLVTEGKVIPDGCLALGRPAKVIRELTEEEIAKNRASAELYMMEASKIKERQNR